MTESDVVCLRTRRALVKPVDFLNVVLQGPLRNTCGHFWLMIWQQCSKAVIMLNRVIEKGSVSPPLTQSGDAEEDGWRNLSLSK